MVHSRLTAALLLAPALALAEPLPLNEQGRVGLGSVLTCYEAFTLRRPEPDFHCDTDSNGRLSLGDALTLFAISTRQAPGLVGVEVNGDRLVASGAAWFRRASER